MRRIMASSLAIPSSRAMSWRRWAADAPKAGFSSPDEMFQFMRAGYGYAKPNELAALRTHNQQIFVPQAGQGPSILPGSQ